MGYFEYHLITMKWKTQAYQFDTRTKEGFLYLPKRIEGKFKWLKKAKWTEVQLKGWKITRGGRVKYKVVWEATKWVVEENNNKFSEDFIYKNFNDKFI